MATPKCACAPYIVLSDDTVVDLRKRSLIALAASALAAPVASFAQRSAAYRIAWLAGGAPDGSREFIEGVKQHLRDLGYSEGKNVVFDFRYAEGKPERLAGLAAKLVALKPDVIVSGATPGTRAAKHATTTIPIVMMGVLIP